MYEETTNPKYGSSLKLLQNWIPLPQGAMTKRPGTRWVGAVKDASYSPRLIPFVFSDDLTFVLEVGNNYARFYRTKQYVGTDGVLHAPGSGAAFYELVTIFVTAMLNFLKWSQVGNVITLCYGGQSAGIAAVAPQDLTHPTGALRPWVIGATPLKYPLTSVPSAPTVAIGAWRNANPVTDTYKLGDMVSFAGVLWVSIQGGNFNNSPPAVPALNAAGDQIAGTIFWQPAADKSHMLNTVTWGCTIVVQDPNGITYESPLGPTTTGTGPISTDRVVPLNILPSGFGPGLPAGWAFLYPRLYRALPGGTFGWVADIPSPLGIPSPIYNDDGRAANYAIQPPMGTDPFIVNGADSFPSVIGYLDQRRLWADSALFPATMFLSKIGDLYNYDSRNTPGTDADSFNLTIASEVLEQIRSFVPKRRGLLLTSQGEWAAAGAGGGAISRSSQEVKKQSAWGSNWLNPINIGTGILFNTAKANMVRDLYPLYGIYADIWDGQDLTVLARHLFDLHTIVDWAFQATPYPIVWATRDDGTMLSLTYQHTPPSFGQQLSEGVVAWARHVTGTNPDLFERVCVVPEPPEDAVYLQTKRAFNGATMRWIERMESPVHPASPFLPGVPDVRYGCYLDAAVLYDGHNINIASIATIDSVAHPGSTTPADYAIGTQVKVTIAVAGPFVAADAVNPYGSGFVFDAENVLGLGVGKAHIVGFTGATVVTVEMDSNLTQAQVTALRAGTSNWAIAKGKVTAAHLNGYPLDSNSEIGARGVTCLVDGDTQLPDVWAAGVASLLIPGVVIWTGIAYNSDFVPMDAWLPSAEIRNKYKNVVRVGFSTSFTRDLWMGPSVDKLVQWQQRNVADEFGSIAPDTGYDEEFIFGEYNKTGSVFVRHWQPLPATITALLREMRLGDT